MNKALMLKRVLGRGRTRLLVAASIVVLGAAVVASAALGTASASSPRSGEFHVTKVCAGTYFGNAGDYCTITWSNLNAIDAGAKVIYTSAAGATSLNSDIVLYDGPGNSAFGHVTLDFATLTGAITFSGGTGQFEHFHASAAVTVTDPGLSTELWHWDGTYSFAPPGHGD